MSVDFQGNEVGKLFVGGLHQSTTNDSLKSYFSKFGDIGEFIVMMDNRTGRSRGFGYVTFKNDYSVDWVLRQKPHFIDNKEVDPKRCNVTMKGKVEIKAMKPQNTQKAEYPTSPPIQGNGRPFGGRNTQYSPLQLNGSYPTWNQWPANWGPPNVSHSQNSQVWPAPIAWTNSGGANQTGAQTAPGSGPPLSALGNWPDKSLGGSNGWISSTWGHQVNGPPTANRVHLLNDEAPIYHQQHPNKPQTTWDSINLASLSAGQVSVQNSVDPLVNSIDSWNQSAAAAALCQLAPQTLNTNMGLGGAHSAAAGVVPTSWNHTNNVSGSVNNQWTSGGVAGPRPNTNHNVTGGFLGETHPNSTAMAAMAAAVGLGNSAGCPPMHHWTSTGSVDPANLKLNDSLYRSIGGGVARNPGQNPMNMSHAGGLAQNGLLSGGDWCTLTATNNLANSQQVASNTNFHSHLYKQ